MPPTTDVDLTDAKRRSLGAFFTPNQATKLMAEWVLDRRPTSVLEPSFGDGAFLHAIEVEAERRGHEIRLVGAELHESTFLATKAQLSAPFEGHVGDFLSLEPESVDAVIGNPPFVRLRNLDTRLRTTALAAAKSSLGTPMEPAGSTWMPFLLRSTEWLRSGGCLAMVMPLEIEHVRYARPLWRFLSKNYGRLKVVRTYERIFGDLLQDVVILLAEEKGKTTDVVEYQVTENLRTLDKRRRIQTLSVEAVAEGERVFKYSLLSSEVQELVQATLGPATVRLGDLADVRIGYVTGDKNFFHPEASTVKRFRLREKSLLRSVGPGRALRHAGLYTSQLADSATLQLWRPGDGRLGKGEQRYVEYGEQLGVHRRYKCSVRDPWYLVPDVRKPDLVFNVFSDSPNLLVNDGGLVASNSMLCGFVRDGYSAEMVAASWYTSVAQLFIELEIHSLGGGVLVAVPREVSNVRLSVLPRGTRGLLRRMHPRHRRNGPSGAVALGDEALIAAGVVSRDQVELIQTGLETMRRWRRRSIR